MVSVLVTRGTMTYVPLEIILIKLHEEGVLQRRVESGVPKGHRRPTKCCPCRFEKAIQLRKRRGYYLKPCIDDK
jgi:hypothetical protein